MSASHIVQARNDLFIGKEEAHIMNRKKMMKSVLSKEGNVCVLHLFVKVPSGAAAPFKYKPMEVDAINQVADEREQKKQMAGGVSVEDRSKRTQTVMGMTLSKTARRTTRTWRTGFDDGSAQVRNIRDPGQPTANEHEEHRTTSTLQVIVQVLCDVTWCELARLKTIRKVCLLCRWIVGSLERESEEQVTLVPFIRERRRNMTWEMLVPREGTEFTWISKGAAKFIDQLGHNGVTLAREIAQARQEGSQTVLERPPVGESQSTGIIECAAGLVAGQA